MLKFLQFSLLYFFQCLTSGFTKKDKSFAALVAYHLMNKMSDLRETLHENPYE